MLESYKKLKIASAKISQMKEIMFNKPIVPKRDTCRYKKNTTLAQNFGSHMQTK